MSTNALLDKPKQNAPLNDSDLSDIVSGYSDQLPQTGWLTELQLQQPRENLKCLPLRTRFSKRILDIVVASGLLLLCGPIMIVAAVLVKITSPGNIIYSQVRIGLNLRKKKDNDRRVASQDLPEGKEDRRGQGQDRRGNVNYGRPFTMYKFRTMRSDAEKKGAQFAQAGDPRVTTFGRFFRRTRIDELPQLWNVLKGDMSMVGPRPERPEFMENLSEQIPNYVNRLGLKPGITGMAQVVNGYDNELEGFKRKVGYDLLYLRNCCLYNDIKILFRTVKVVITGQGAL